MVRRTERVGTSREVLGSGSSGRCPSIVLVDPNNEWYQTKLHSDA